MLGTIVDILFGCSHSNYSFPRTVKAGQRRSPAASVTGTYIVCVDCGKEFPYDWHAMKVVSMPSESKHRIREAIESYASK